MARALQKRNRRSGKSPLLPEVSQRGVGAAVFCLVLTLIGVVFAAAGINKAAPISQVVISLERAAPRDVRGSMTFELFGVPIFWRSLDGLRLLQNQDYKKYDFTNSSRPRFRGEANVSRMGFVDDHGKTLAWSERGAVWNAQDRIKEFLAGSAPRFEFKEERWPVFGDSSRTESALAAFSLFALAALFAGLGLGRLTWMVFVKSAKPAAETLPETMEQP